MTVTVFTWDMFRGGVGHASMHVHGSAGNIYISFWPAEHRAQEALSSVGKIHFMRADKDADGIPSWASRPIDDLNEAKIVRFWRDYDATPFLDYKGKASNNAVKTNEGGKRYNIFFSQCSTTVVAALLAGADGDTRKKIERWILLNAGTNADFPGIKILQPFVPLLRIPTVTPADVRELVRTVWKDSL